MFIGFVQQDATLKGDLITKNGSRVPTNADALPTFRVYGPDGFLVNGTCTVLDAINVSGGYRYSITASGANGFATGNSYSVVISYAVGGISYAQLHRFAVV